MKVRVGSRLSRLDNVNIWVNELQDLEALNCKRALRPHEMISSTNDTESSTNGSYDVTWMHSGCVVVKTISSDVPGQLISNDVEQLVDRIKSAILMPIFFLIGSPTNCLSLVVFYRQGLTSRVNLCLFCLAFVDLLNTSFSFILYAERVYTQFTTVERYTQVFVFVMNNIFMGLYGSSYSAKILVTLIACDRCLSILLPLKAKTIVSAKGTAVLLFVSLATTYSCTFFVSSSYRMTCVYDLTRNRTSYEVSQTEFSRQNKVIITALDNIFLGFIVSVGCPLIVFVATVIMIVKMKEVAKWRKNTSSSESLREVALTRMLLALSVEFLVCSVPHLLFWITPLFIPDFRTNRLHLNTRDVLLSLLQMTSNWSSCSSFFVYYIFGSKYRETVRKLLCADRALLIRSQNKD